METFFFISLAITFILVLLLVYHFKQRFNNLEQKTDTMFEIINNIVKEITVMKQTIISQMCTPIPVFSPEYKQDNYNKVIEELEKEDEDLDEYYDSDVEDIKEDEDDVEEEEDTEEDHNDKEDIEKKEEEQQPTDEEEYEEIKVINYDVNLDISEEIQEIQETQENLSDYNEYTIDEISDNIEIKESENDEILVNKLEETIEIPEKVTKDDKDIYKKMTIQQLRTLVLSKGFVNDINKMKKNELIKILENMNE